MLTLRKGEKKHLLIYKLFNSSCFGFFQYSESVVLTQKVVLIVKNFNQVKLPKLRLYCLWQQIHSQNWGRNSGIEPQGEKHPKESIDVIK